MMRVSMLLWVPLLAASLAADGLAAVTPPLPGPGGAYNASGQQQLLFRRRGPQGKG
jgi:hypothetical protein